MRGWRLLIAIAAATLCVSLPARADETDKLTYLSFSKPVQLPGVTLPAGRYRFQLADVEESRRVTLGLDRLHRPGLDRADITLEERGFLPVIG